MKKRSKLLYFFTVLACPSIMHTAALAENKPSSYVVPWQIVTGDAPFGIKTVTPFTELTKARLLPKRLVLNNENIVDSKGKSIVPANTEMSVLQSQKFVACTIKAPSKKGLNSVIFLGTDRYLCFVDDDRDGSFDYYFGKATAMTGIFAGFGNIPTAQKDKILKQAVYREELPTSSKDTPRIAIRYARNHYFESCIEGAIADQGGCFGEKRYFSGEPLPSKFELLGASFEFLSKEENRVTIRMDSSIKAQNLLLYYK